ncbi:MAG: RES family NAD+ phosphorylase [Acidimicrobiia bacterium]|nr:RES family NAD+ phosphorylase [Acidimicrobiia bacterium]MDQ3499523.1 RES family NAD+ phosphorylase [Actinomycetota bacterium]
MSPVSRPAGGIASVEPAVYRGSGYRHQSPGYDPLAGEGARIIGSRFNPANSFPVLYLCTSRACAVAEFKRLGEQHVIGGSGLLPRELYKYQVQLSRVLDLTSPTTLAMIGIEPSRLVGPDWSECQQLGQDAYTAGFHAIRSRSATGVDEILAVFSDRIGAEAKVEPRLVEVWSAEADL